MAQSTLLRASLTAATLFNIGGAYLFAFPESFLGQLVGLPAAPAAYRAMTALFVLLFAGAYAWLARQETIHREFITFTAIGKLSAFTVVVALWLSNALPTQVLVPISGDLILAVLFLYGLRKA